MSTTAGTPHAVEPTDNSVAAQQPLAVYTCSRLGRTANPPSFSLAGRLLPGRRG